MYNTKPLLFKGNHKLNHSLAYSSLLCKGKIAKKAISVGVYFRQYGTVIRVLN